MQRPATTPASEAVVTGATAQTPQQLLRCLLPRVSRSFYLSLRILPQAPGRCIGLAYLLARSADTLSDSPLLAPPQRRQHLLQLQRQLHQGFDPDWHRELMPALEAAEPDDAEYALLQALPDQFAMLAAVGEFDRRQILALLDTLISGMCLDLDRFTGHGDGIRALDDARQTEEYCYLVAGCVGGFWTRVLQHYLGLFPESRLPTLISNAEDFGRALQLINILRDLRADLLQGRCYLPAPELAGAGLQPADLLDGARCRQAIPILDNWLRRAAKLCRYSESYLQEIPRRHWQLRLAVLWPALIGLRTLLLLARQRDWPCHPHRIKVSRRRVYAFILVSLAVVFSNRLSRACLDRGQRRLAILLTKP